MCVCVCVKRGEINIVFTESAAHYINKCLLFVNFRDCVQLKNECFAVPMAEMVCS